jgi:hypothetical protein
MGYGSDESHGQSICVINDKEIFQANNSIALVLIPTIPIFQGCERGQEPNYGFLNK